MRRLIYIGCLSLCAMLITTAVSAQDKTDGAKKADSAKAEKQAPAQGDKVIEDTIDLDAFFKKGEENAKKGSSCEKPAEPIA